MAKEKIRNYTATLYINNRRDVYTLSPKILLTAVVNLDKDKVFRDHVWVSLDKQMSKIVNQCLSNTLKIKFTAKEYSYVGSNGENKSLRQIRNIKTEV